VKEIEKEGQGWFIITCALLAMDAHNYPLVGLSEYLFHRNAARQKLGWPRILSLDVAPAGDGGCQPNTCLAYLSFKKMLLFLFPLLPRNLRNGRVHIRYNVFNTPLPHISLVLAWIECSRKPVIGQFGSNHHIHHHHHHHHPPTPLRAFISALP
jgi:hypothetical protein